MLLPDSKKPPLRAGKSTLLNPFSPAIHDEIRQRNVKGDGGTAAEKSFSIRPNQSLSRFASQQYIFPAPGARPYAHSHDEVKWQRLALVSVGSGMLAVFAFRQFNQYFGKMDHPFRINNDWKADHALHFDELLHFQGNYRITQGLTGFFRWSGINSPKAELFAATTTVTLMTLLEYVDGRRPNSEASYSDLIANSLGVGFYLARSRFPVLQDFDLSFSYRTPADIFSEARLKDYGRMTHWLTYNLKRRLRVPLHIGLGYGVHNAFRSDVKSRFYASIGVSPADVMGWLFPSAVESLSWLGIYHLGWHIAFNKNANGI